MSLGIRQLHDLFAMPLIPIVQEIGLRGMPIDAEKRDAVLFDLELRQKAIEAELKKAGVTAFDKRASLGWQLRGLGVPLETFTDRGSQLKTDLEVFGWLNFRQNVRREREGKPARFPFLRLLIDRARLEKAKSNLRSFCVCLDGMLRTRLNSCGTATWRYASAGWGTKNKPGFCPTCRLWTRHGTNMQNIPKDNKELGVNVKELFVPKPGWMLGELDYSGFELMIQAHWMRSSKLVTRLSDPAFDPHSYHASLMWADFPGKDSPVGKRQRATMKNVIYGARGGGGPRALAAAMAKKDEFFESAECAKFKETIFAEYPEFQTSLDTLEEQLDTQLANGERRIVRDFLGRPRILFGREPLKEAIATIVSGSGASIFNCVVKRLATYHPRAFNRLCMQVHDSAMVHAPKEEFDDVMETIYTEMRREVWQWGETVSYAVDMKASDESWSAMTEYAA